MESAAVRVCRGRDWGERLTATLKMSPLGEVNWMEQHTQVLKSDSHSRVGLLQLDGSLCYLKFYSAKSWGQKMLYRLGYARGLRSFDAATQLLQVGVQVPAPHSCVLSPNGMMLLTEGVAGGKDLKALWQGNIKQPQQELLLASAGRILARLHGAGYCHGDCKWSNLLWSGNGFYLVDLEGVKRAPLGGKRQARDLARFTVNAEDLGVSPASFDCFLESYLAAVQLSREKIIAVVMPPLEQLRVRHETKYGKRGQRILGQS